MKIENLFSPLFAWQKHDGTFGFTFDLKYRRDANSPISVDPPVFSHKWPYVCNLFSANA